MRIGINAHLLSTRASYRQTGVNRYIDRLLRALPAALNADDDLIAFAGCAIPPLAPTLDRGWRRSRLGTEHPAVRIGWEWLALPMLARRERLDLLHGPMHVVPALTGCPTVVTIHDLAYMRLPAGFRAGRRRYLGPATRAAVRRAARVITVSRQSKNDVVELLDVPPERVVVIPLAADESFRPVEPARVEAFRQERGLTRPFVLYVGTLEPRKNVPTLLRAFAAIAPSVPHELILVGAEGWLTDEIHATLRDLNLGDRIRLLGFAEDKDLPSWYNAADLFVYPSRYEGFGLPPLEAMACGVPVVTSSVSSLPEVVADAALTIDPADEEALAAAMQRVLTDPALAADLRARGLNRAGQFSWARTAAETVALYREVAG